MFELFVTACTIAGACLHTEYDRTFLTETQCELQAQEVRAEITGTMAASGYPVSVISYCIKVEAPAPAPVKPAEPEVSL